MPWRTLVNPVCRALHLGGITTSIVGGLYAVEVPNTSTGQAGAAAAISGCVIALASAVFGYLEKRDQRRADRDQAQREERRQVRAERDLQGQLDVAKRERDAVTARLRRLESVSSEVPANAGRLDASLSLLAEKGWIERPSRADAPPHTAWPTVLVVEDDPSTMRAWTSILTRKGFDVLAAGTVEVAVAKLELRPSFALLDLTLPDGNGESVLEAIHALGLPTKVVVVSGSADQERRKKIEAAFHPAAILPKPANLMEILAILQPSKSDDDLPVYRPPPLSPPPKGG
jgi:ActR/RegA family two-component response regulator